MYWQSPFYFAYQNNLPGKNSAEVAELNTKLFRLREKLEGIHHAATSAYMLLRNFLYLDPEYNGPGQLKNANRIAKAAFREYEDNLGELRNIAESILALVNHDMPQIGSDILIDDITEVREGMLLACHHMRRERNRRIVEQKKKRTLNKLGYLKCEVCDFDFKETYGDVAERFIECHHTKSVSQIKIGEETTLDDLALVCSNCHRMIHRNRPWLTNEQLRSKFRREN